MGPASQDRKLTVVDEEVRASIALYSWLFEFWDGPISIGLRKVDHYECYDSFDWAVQCLSKPSPSFRFLLLLWELGVSVRPCITRKEVFIGLDPFLNSFFLAPLLVLSRPLGPGTRSCCGASRDNQSLE